MASYTMYVLCGVYALFIFLIGMYVYGFAIYCQYKRLQKRSMSINNLLTMGFYLCNASQLLVSLPLVIINSFNGRWTFGHVACMMEGFWVHFTAATAVGHLAMTAIDHHQAIKTEKAFVTGTSRKRKLFFCVSPWVYGFACSCPPIFGWSKYVPEGMGIGCSVEWTSRSANNLSYTMTIMVTSFLLPLAIIAVVYVRIFAFVKGHNRQFNLLLVGMNSNTQRKFSQIKADSNERRLAKVTMMAVALFCLCWTPYTLASLYSIFGPSFKGNQILFTAPQLIAKSTALIQGAVMAKPPFICSRIPTPNWSSIRVPSIGSRTPRVHNSLADKNESSNAKELLSFTFNNNEISFESIRSLDRETDL